MNREFFLNQLKIQLEYTKLTKEEVEEAMSYYEEYFDEAGKQEETRVLKELESPEKIVKKILEEVKLQHERAPQIKRARVVTIGLSVLLVSSIIYKYMIK